MNNFNKDSFEAFMQLAEFRRQIREARSGRQWQATYAVWALIVGVTIQSSRLHWEYVVGFVVIIASMHTFWLHWHARRSEADQQKMMMLQDRAAAMLGIAQAAQRKWNGLFWHPPSLMQLATTLLLSAICLIVKHGAINLSAS